MGIILDKISNIDKSDNSDSSPEYVEEKDNIVVNDNKIDIYDDFYNTYLCSYCEDRINKKALIRCHNCKNDICEKCYNNSDSFECKICVNKDVADKYGR